MSEEIKKLELRIEELENQLRNVGSQTGDIDPEKMKIYEEVSAQLGDPKLAICSVCQPCTLCQPCTVCRTCTVCRVCKVCQVCQVCHVCINECSCGPCIMGSSSYGSGRFNNLG